MNIEQGNALDLCFVSNSSFIRNINVLTKNEICSSYHITFELTSRAKIKSSKIYFFDFKRANWNDLNRDLNSVPWDQHIFSCDPNEGWSLFRNKFNSLIKIHIPSITIKDHGRPPGLTLKHLICVKKSTST